MKRLKPEKKKLVVSIVAVILIIAMVLSIIIPFVAPVFGADFNESDITVEANIGFDGNIKAANNISFNNSLTEFNLNIKNNSNNVFNGSINIPLKTNDISSNDEYIYENLKAEIELNPKTEKNIVLTSNITTVIKNFDIEVKDDKNNVVTKKSVNVKLSPETAEWFGFISDNPEKLNYLKLKFDDQTALFFNFDENNFPKSENVLANINVIVLNNFDFDRFNEEQKDTLRRWINNGGIFVCGNDFNKEFENRYSMLEKDSSLLESVQKYSAAFNEYDNEILEKIYVCKYGYGNIYYNDFSISENENILNSYILGSEFTSVLENCNKIINTEKSNSLERIMYYNTRMPFFNDAVIKIIFIVIFIYFIFIGFILYFILKKKDKLKYTLIILPSFSLILTLIIYMCSFSTVYKRPIANVITYFEQNNNSEFLNPISAVNISSSDKGNIKINIPNERSVLCFRNEHYNVYENSISSDKKVFKRERCVGEENYLVSLDKEKWGKTNFIVMDKFENNGGIDIDLKIAENEFVGSITNNTGYDLYDVVVGNSNRDNFFVVDELKNGDKIDIGEGNYTYSLNESLYKSDSILIESGSNINDKERKYELELRQDIFNGLTDYSDGIAFEVFGFNKENILNNEFITNGKSPEITNTNVFYARKDINIDDFYDGLIPQGFIMPVIENSDGYIDTYTNNIYPYDTKIPVKVSFTIPDYISVNGFELELDDDKCKNSIYNYRINEWENAESIYNDNFSDYLNENNKILISIESEKDEISAPQISVSVSGGEADAWDKRAC